MLAVDQDFAGYPVAHRLEEGPADQTCGGPANHSGDDAESLVVVDAEPGLKRAAGWPRGCNDPA